MFEKDRGEPSLLDFTGGGIRYSAGRLNAVLGEYDLGVGQGLVFASSYGRSTSQLAEETGPAADLRLLRHAEESAPMSGAGVGFGVGRMNAVGFFSYTSRDARLNPDGSVERLESGGVHDDSIPLAQRNQVQVVLGAGAVRFRLGALEVGVHAGQVGFSRQVVPRDSSDSFVGRNLTNAGVLGIARFGPWKTEAEIATSVSGMAGAARLTGDWDALAARAALRWRERRYFAPYGRWTGLTGRRERLEAIGGLQWRRSGLRVGVSGNTYRDFELDSLPARVELTAGQTLGGVVCDLKLGRRFRLAEERYRTASIDVRVKAGRLSRYRSEVRLMFRDEYPETRPGRGRVIGCAGMVQRGSWQFGGALARFDITTDGLRMYMNEPDAMRIGSAYSTTRPAWRAAAVLALDLERVARLGLKVGCEHAGRITWDGAAQLDVTLRR